MIDLAPRPASASPSLEHERVRRLIAGVRAEEERNTRLLHLTANEPLMSDTARSFMGSRISDRYYMGGGDEEGVVDFGPFTFLGWPSLQALVSDAEAAAAAMLSAHSVSLACLSGVHAMMCALLCTTEPGDGVMSVDLEHGGHFATKLIIERTGRRHLPTSYDLDGLRFDAERLAADFRQAGARAFYMDVSFCVNPHNLREIREALGPEALIIYDASHAMGLIMGGRFQAPLLEGADVICGNTHKTLPGPQKGLIAFRDAELARRAGEVLNAGLFSSSHTSSVAALAITILEMQAHGVGYARQVVANSNALGEALALRGLAVRRANSGRWSENHQVHLFTEGLGEYRELYAELLANGIVVNFDQTLGGRMFIRLGTQELTRRGMREEQMRQVAALLDGALHCEPVRDAAERLAAGFQAARFSFDDCEPAT
ncbi:MAG: hypothetical protein ACTHN3_08010 [Solirubrobacterales bacterium]